MNERVEWETLGLLQVYKGTAVHLDLNKVASSVVSCLTLTIETQTHTKPLARNCWRLLFACVNLWSIMLIGRSCCEPLTQECLNAGNQWKDMNAKLFLSYCAVIFTNFSLIFMRTCLRRLSYYNKNDQFWDVEKQNFIWIPMWPLFATNIAQYEKKSHHWASCHINYIHTYNTWKCFLVISKCCLCQVCKTANAEKTSVVFNFPVHWPSFFAEWWDEGSD